MVRYKFRKRQKKEPRRYPWLILVLLLALALLMYLPFQVSTCFKYSSNFNLIIANQDGNLEVTNFDNQNQEITTIIIPGSTQLIASRQLGSWKARGLWQLGINEDYSGELMRETVIKNLFMPVSAWASYSALGLVQGNFWQAVKSIVTPYKSSLKLGDKIKLALLSLRVSSLKKTTINLEDTGFLKAARLTDGENGYLVSGDIPTSIASIFSDNLFFQKEVMILIKNYSSDDSVAESVGKVIEVLGAKVSSVTKEDSSDTDCTITGKDRALVSVFGSVFNCAEKIGSPDGKFDIEMDLGEQFVKRY
ncbi:MAG: hypothetical protein ABSA43_00515 [Candidatus Microgenomates bacterium]